MVHGHFPAFTWHTLSHRARKAAFTLPISFLSLHSLWLLISVCAPSHLTGRLATKTANYSAKTDLPFHHSLSIRTHIHHGTAAPSGAPRSHLSASLKGTHVSVENLQGHLQTCHSRKAQSRLIRVRDVSLAFATLWLSQGDEPQPTRWSPVRLIHQRGTDTFGNQMQHVVFLMVLLLQLLKSLCYHQLEQSFLIGVKLLISCDWMKNLG